MKATEAKLLEFMKNLRNLSFPYINGFEIKEVQPIDMFPHTSHVETVVLMSRVDK